MASDNAGMRVYIIVLCALQLLSKRWQQTQRKDAIGRCVRCFGAFDPPTQPPNPHTTSPNSSSNHTAGRIRAAAAGSRRDRPRSRTGACAVVSLAVLRARSVETATSRQRHRFNSPACPPTHPTPPPTPCTHSPAPPLCPSIRSRQRRRTGWPPPGLTPWCSSTAPNRCAALSLQSHFCQLVLRGPLRLPLLTPSFGYTNVQLSNPCSCVPLCSLLPARFVSYEAAPPPPIAHARASQGYLSFRTALAEFLTRHYGHGDVSAEELMVTAGGPGGLGLGV